jgi:2-polyprenyl-3-methyl-5-hydroxy-6-metoxy-1,4-benzoquinol methylase
MKSLIRKIITKSIKNISFRAVNQMVKSNSELKEMWDISLKHFPDFRNHFTIQVDCKETEARIRLLVIFEALFLKKAITKIKNSQEKITYADVGDSDGSIQMLLSVFFSKDELSSLGINLQEAAVEKIKNLGFDAICADALKLRDNNTKYDVISVFETLEHLPDPLGFLTEIRPIVNNQLIISVPYIRGSRVGLAYLKNNWNIDRKATIENQHIFELSTADWEKIFKHTGWTITHQEKLLMYPRKSPYRLVLEPFWRYRSFEGFWFVALEKDSTYTSRYVIE